MKYSDRTERRLHAWIGRDCQIGEPTPLHEIVAPAIALLPADIAAPLKREFYRRIEASTDQLRKPGEWLTDWTGKYAAHDWIAEEVRALRAARLDVAFSEEEIDIQANKFAAICRFLRTYEHAVPYVKKIGVAVPEIKGRVTAAGIAKRFHCKRWWRRQLRKLFTRTAETHLREIGLVQKRKQLYASDRAVAWRKDRKMRDRALLQELVAVSGDGDQLALFDVVQKSQANPALRRAELMLRARGFDEVAIAAGHGADFWTLTAPSAFHRTNGDGKPNPNYEGFTVRDAQAWLCKQWARVRAKLKRLSILFYGFRIAEPHHDATPHWHVLLFTPAHHIERVREVIKGFWLGEYSHEQGAKEHRTKVVTVDRAKGSAAGYIAKYVAKNIDGFQVGEDYEAQGTTPATESVDRVSAWASAHGIRQFQQLGGPPVSVWRELRRLRVGLDVEAHPLIESARVAADAGEWADFIAAVGGIERGRKGNVKLSTECTGELTQYDELRGPQIVGVHGVERTIHAEPLDTKAKTKCRLVRKFRYVEWAGIIERVRTRTKTWRIQRKASDSGGGAETGRAANSFRSGQMSSLGPVSITVRDLKTVPSARNFKTTRHQSRGDPPWLN